MRKKLVFSGMVLLALVLTTGTFAYTYTNVGTMSVQPTYVDAAYNTIVESAVQPDWSTILPEGEFHSETLIPVAPGDDTELPTQYPAEGEHWDKVTSADDLDTYVSTRTSKNWERDLYNLSAYTGYSGAETILGVTVHFRFAAGGGYNVRGMASIKTNGSVYDGPTITTDDTAFINESWPMDVNPNTGEAWTWEEVNALQAGVTLRGNAKAKPAICTQVYVTVNFEFIQVQGAVPTGDLFEVIPQEEFFGDLVVTVYLTNTAELLKAYRYLNMKVYTTNSVEAGGNPNYKVMSLENGVATFNLEGGSAMTYYTRVIGGAYYLMSDDTEEWNPGWNIEPEFYCEVSQR